MANASVDGLISGLATTDVINQLMQLERQPQVRLQQKRKALDGITSAYQDLNRRFDALRQAASALSDAAAWQAMKATTGDPSRLTATASATALAADLTVSVERLASAHSVVSERSVAGLDAVVANGPITFTVDGVAAAAIDPGDGTLASVVSAVNAAGVGVRAAAVQVSPGQYRLQLTAATTGSSGTFTVDPTSLAALADPSEAVPDPEAFDVVAAGIDAEIKIGGAAGYSVTSATNAFSDLLPGVSLTAVKADPGVSVAVSVSADADELARKVEKLVAAVSSVMGYIEESTAYDSTTGAKGKLLGDNLTRQLQHEVYSSLGIDLAGRSLRDVGMRIGEAGLELDKQAFLAAYAADPQMVIDAFTGASTIEAGDGLAVKLAALGTVASHESSGMISVAIASKDRQAELFARQIEAWDVRLTKREEALRRQFSAMEVALSALQNQSSWLAGQISGLPSWE